MGKINGLGNKPFSRSFLIIGNNIDISKIKNKDIKNKEIIVFGDTLDEGQDIFKVDSIDKLIFLKAYHKLKLTSLSYIDAIVFTEDCYDGIIDSKKIPNNGNVRYLSGMRDSESSNCLDDLIKRYDNTGEVKKEMQKLLRGKKINKIDKK